MSYPSASHPASPHGGIPSPGNPIRSITASPRAHPPRHVPAEGEHQLEKLEFSLAIALTRGDHDRSARLREQIALLGGNREEPGT